MTSDEFFELLETRRSVRRYADRKPDRAAVEKVLAAANFAPSNHNRQGWKFLVFEDRDEIRELADRAREIVRAKVEKRAERKPAWAEEVLKYVGGFDAAPVVILVMHKLSLAMGRSLAVESGVDSVSSEALSAAMAVENLLLMAHALGLGACMMTAPLLAGELWKSLPEMPPGFIPTCLVTLGYAAETPTPPRKKEAKDVIEYRNA